MYNVGSVNMGCYGCGELLPGLSCSCKPNIFDLIQYVSKGGELAIVVFSLAQRLSLCIPCLGPICCPVRLEMLSHTKALSPCLSLR